MAKPPSSVGEKRNAYERRLLDSGWYDGAMAHRRAEAEAIASDPRRTEIVG